MEFKLLPVGPAKPQHYGLPAARFPNVSPFQTNTTPFLEIVLMTDGRKERLLLGQDGGRPRSVKVDDLPFAIPAVPDTGLLRLGGAGDAAGVQVLCDADVGDAG